MYAWSLRVDWRVWFIFAQQLRQLAQTHCGALPNHHANKTEIVAYKSEIRLSVSLLEEKCALGLIIQIMQGSVLSTQEYGSGYFFSEECFLNLKGLV